MLKSFLLISFRNISQNKGASLLNLVCLAFALATCLFIFNYLYYELGYEAFHQKADSLYRVETHTLLNYDVEEKNAYTPYGLGEQLVTGHPEVTASTTLRSYSENGNAFFTQERPGDEPRRIYLERTYFVQESFLDLFTLNFLAGDPSSALSQDHSLIISLNNFKSIFGESADPTAFIGTRLLANNLDLTSVWFTLSGVFQDLPDNTHLRFDALASAPEAQINKEANTYFTYLQIPAGGDAVNTKLGKQQKSLSESLNKVEIYALRPIKKIHIAAEVSNEPGVNTNPLFLLFLGIMGLIILILACTNFINNAIINSVDRAREIGVRRIAGMLPKQLFYTILTESLIVNSLAALLGLGLFILGLRSLITLADFSYPIYLDAATILMSLWVLLVMVLVITLLTGIYPALLQLSLKPVEALRGPAKILTSKQSSRGSKVIRGLVIFQLAMSIVFLSAMYVVQEQLAFVRADSNVPYRMNLTLKFGGLTGVNEIYTQQATGFLSGFGGNANTRVHGITNLYLGDVKTERKIKSLYRTDIDTAGIDAPFVMRVADRSFWAEKPEVFISGGNFSTLFGKDHDKAIINESAMRALKFENPEQALEKQIGMFNGFLYIKGVIANESEDELPIVYLTGYRYPVYFDISFNTMGKEAESVNRTISTIQMRWERQFPWAYFIDRKFEDQSVNEATLLSTFSLFTVIAVCIASLGIFILSTFTTIKRTKEIGIRKVMGASIPQILLILIYDFLKLLAVSCVIAMPLALIGTNQWLNSQPKHIDLSPVFFAWPVLAMLLLACIIITVQSWQTLVLNPIKALRAN